MGIARANIWISDVADACGTWKGTGRATIFDCKGVLEWPCGRYLAPNGTWMPVPNGQYRNLPYRCGHLEVELPPGCYWTVAGNISFWGTRINLNYTTHVGIFEADCDETACVKLYNPSIRLCWNWFWIGLRMLSIPHSEPVLNPERVHELGKMAEEVLAEIPTLAVEKTIGELFDELVRAAESGEKDEPSVTM